MSVKQQNGSREYDNVVKPVDSADLAWASRPPCLEKRAAS
jgi:hypothetical protein